MKIAHILLTSRFAGTERYVIDLANEQAKTHDVTVVLHRRATEIRPDALAHRFGPAVNKVIVGGKWWWTVWQVRRALRALAPDVAHAHLSLACRSLSGLTMPGLRVATLHIRYKPSQHAAMDGLIAIAPWQLNALPEAMRLRTRQIDNWAHVEPVGETERAAKRRAWGIADDDYLIGALGRIEPSKGMDALVRAFGRLSVSRTRLAVVGSGSQLQSLRRVAPASVILPGFSERPQECFAAFDAFVSAARSEPFGFVLMEAMASGLPVLATSTDGARHLQALIGQPLVPCDDEDALVCGLQALAAARPARQHYDLSGYQLSAKAAEVEAWYSQALACKRTAQARSNSQTR